MTDREATSNMLKRILPIACPGLTPKQRTDLHADIMLARLATPVTPDDWLRWWGRQSLLALAEEEAAPAPVPSPPSVRGPN